MYLIVGLGNPEQKNEKTFHNMGFIVAGDVAESLGVKFKKKECEASVAEAFVGGEKVIIARPVTYMNNSGRAVKQLAAKYKVPPENTVVIYDDYDIPKGKIGIRDAAVNIPIIDYVLSEVRKEDYPLFGEACKKAAEAAVAFVKGMKIDDVMSRYNG